MHSIINLFKINDLKLKPLDYELMSLSELEFNLKRINSLLANKRAIDALSDKGDRLREQKRKIQELIEVHQAKEELNKKVEIQLEIAQEVVSQMVSNDVCEKVQIKEEHTEKNIEDMKNENKADCLTDQLKALNVSEYKEADQRDELKTNIENTSSKSKTNKLNKENLSEEEKLKLFIERVKSDMNDEKKLRKTKMIPVDECSRLLREHEKKIQELQIKQATEKLLEGRSVVYDYSFGDVKESLPVFRKYRDIKRDEHDEFFNDDYSDEYDEDEEEYEEEQEHFEKSEAETLEKLD